MSKDNYGSIPDINPDTAGRGHRDVEGANQVLSIPKDEADQPQSRTSVPSYVPDTPEGT